MKKKYYKTSKCCRRVSERVVINVVDVYWNKKHTQKICKRNPPVHRLIRGTHTDTHTSTYVHTSFLFLCALIGITEAKQWKWVNWRWICPKKRNENKRHKRELAFHDMYRAKGWLDEWKDKNRIRFFKPTTQSKTIMIIWFERSRNCNKPLRNQLLYKIACRHHHRRHHCISLSIWIVCVRDRSTISVRTTHRAQKKRLFHSLFDLCLAQTHTNFKCISIHNLYWYHIEFVCSELALCRVFVCDYICFSFSRYFILLVLDLELNVGGFRVRFRSNDSKLKKYRRQMCEYRVSNFVGKKVHTIEKTTYGFLALCFAFSFLLARLGVPVIIY